MLVLGVCGGHDANWCLFQDGKMIGAFEKERFTKIRHDSGQIMDLVKTTLNSLGFTFNDVDVVVTSEHNHIGTESGLMLLSDKKYNSFNDWIENSTMLDGRKVPVFSIPHHLCHAAYAHYFSGKRQQVVLTLDGGGDFYTVDAYTSTSVSLWEDGKLTWIERVGNSDIGSLWDIYSKVIFGNGQAAGKLMGLSAYGDNSLVQLFEQLYVRPTRGLLKNAWSIKSCWADEDYPMFNNEKDWKSKNAKNIAHAIQELTMMVSTQLCEEIKKTTRTSFLALSGGVALNGYMNTCILNSGMFESVFIPPSVHDGGLSIGAALFTINNILGMRSVEHTNDEIVFTGLDYKNDDIYEALNKYGLSYELLDNESKVKIISNEIQSGKIISNFESKSEHGPRALGHRSIIASPTIHKMKDRINSNIKFRESFRPLAPVVLEEDIDFCTSDIKRSPFMMHIVTTKEEFRKLCPSGVHVDGSARVQTVNSSNTMGLILKELKKSGQPPALLNTSFNVLSPIVETPEDAIKTFLKVPIDSLYLGNFRVVK